MPERTCPRCQHHGPKHRWWAHRADGVICPRCHLTERITQILDDGSGSIAPALLPLHRAICDQPRPDTGLVWLVDNQHVPALLSDLATGRLPLTHETLDSHPSPRSVTHLRDLLVQHRILEHRDHYLVLFENWLRRTLATIEPAEDQQLVRHFATWHSLRKLRERAGHQPLTPILTARPRHEITSARTFLAWLRDHNTTPANCTQAHLDTWIATGNSSRQGSRAFIVWASKRGTMPRHLHLPYHQKAPRDTICQRPSEHPRWRP